MEIGVLNARDRGVISGAGYGETNKIALERAIDEMRAAGGGTIFIPTGIYELPNPINVVVSTAPSASGTVRITGEKGATLAPQNENSMFVVTDVCDSGSAGHVAFEGLRFQGKPLAG
ncbi:MAG TPA: hypothetical protein VKR56_00540 [Candidatus Cybelea sp.]|nr:hypothetical protein [Candidatus Cybelea sp.]